MTSFEPKVHREDAAARSALRTDLEVCGYFPALVEDSVLLAVGEEPILDFVVQHEPTFNRDEIRRHLTVLVRTPSRLIISHTDEQPADGMRTGVQAASSTETIPLTSINAVALTRVISDPANFTPEHAAYESWLTVSWGSLSRVDLEPATCPDPTCEADHGLTGTIMPDDLTVRMSAAADGPTAVNSLVRFSTGLQQVTGRGNTTTVGR